MSEIPRGLRNMNPGNIRKSSSSWAGKVRGSDKAFETFSSMTYGVRALAKLLLTYQDKYDCASVADIISRWAPPEENATRIYIDRVAQAIGVQTREPIDVHDPYVLTGLVWAIAGHENGPAACAKYLSRHEVDAGVAMALEGGR